MRWVPVCIAIIIIIIKVPKDSRNGAIYLAFQYNHDNALYKKVNTVMF